MGGYPAANPAPPDVTVEGLENPNGPSTTTTTALWPSNCGVVSSEVAARDLSSFEVVGAMEDHPPPDAGLLDVESLSSWQRMESLSQIVGVMEDGWSVTWFKYVTQFGGMQHASQILLAENVDGLPRGVKYLNSGALATPWHGQWSLDSNGCLQVLFNCRHNVDETPMRALKSTLLWHKGDNVYVGFDEAVRRCTMTKLCKMTMRVAPDGTKTWAPDDACR